MSLAERARAHDVLAWHEPADEAELLALLRGRPEARCFVPVGRASRLGWGAPSTRGSELLSFAKLNRITLLDPADLCVTAEAGLTLAALEAALAPHGLMLDSGPFAASDERTLGGLFAEAPPSSRGHDRGALRSQVLGLRGVDAHGRVFTAGGRVIKNVAGYDLMRLFVGSGGAYFAALELTLRLVRRPEAQRALESETLPPAEAAARWLALRRQERELRALDLVLTGEGGARLRALFEGPSALIAHLQDSLAPTGLRPAAWDAPAPELVPSEAAPAETWYRGWAPPARIAALLASLPQDARGRVFLQGDFVLHAPGAWPSAWPQGSRARALRCAPGVVPVQTELPAPVQRTQQRLRAAFGSAFAPGRLSFDHADRADGAHA